MCARRFLAAIFILTLIVVAGAFAIFQFGQRVLISQATPQGHFQAPANAGPDYSDPQNWIVRSAIRAWEEVEGKPHPTPARTSGQTDISTIRNLGIPTARTGWVSTPDKTPDEYRQGLGGMGVSYPPDTVATCRKLVYSIIDTCTRTRA